MDLSPLVTLSQYEEALVKKEELLEEHYELTQQIDGTQKQQRSLTNALKIYNKSLELANRKIDNLQTLIKVYEAQNSPNNNKKRRQCEDQ